MECALDGELKKGLVPIHCDVVYPQLTNFYLPTRERSVISEPEVECIIFAGVDESVQALLLSNI